MDVQTSKSSPLQYLEPLLIVSKCFGVSFPQNRRGADVLWTIYSIVLASVVFAAYFEMLILKVSYSPELSRNLFFVLMDTLCEVFLIMSDIFTLVETVFKRQLTLGFLDLVMKDDLNQNRSPKRRHLIYQGEYTCALLCVAIYHIYHLYAFVFRIPDVFLRYIFFREISLYLTAINLLQLYSFVLIIRDKYMVLNRSLQKTTQKGVYNIVPNDIDIYLRKYVEYCKLVDVFNKLFGSRIFWVIGYVVIDTVEGFQIGLNCFAHVRLHRLGEDSCEFVGAATLTELSIYSVCRYHFYFKNLLNKSLFILLLDSFSYVYSCLSSRLPSSRNHKRSLLQTLPTCSFLNATYWGSRCRKKVAHIGRAI